MTEPGQDARWALAKPQALASARSMNDTSNHVTNEMLMLGFVQGSPEAFDQLFGPYRQAIYAFFYRRLPNPNQAEELSQETFIALLRSPDASSRERCFAATSTPALSKFFALIAANLSFALLSLQIRARQSRPKLSWRYAAPLASWMPPTAKFCCSANSNNLRRSTIRCKALQIPRIEPSPRVNVNGASCARFCVPQISQRMDASRPTPVGICRLCAYPPCLGFVSAR
jgi:hypothetical protein